MPISSMTGFARVEGALAPWSWHWEAKSVNGRGLELRFRLPPGLDLLESELRARAQRYFKRGNVQATLQMERAAGAGAIRINRDALSAILKALDELREKSKLPAPDPAAILALKGVIETGGEDDDEALIAERNAKLLDAADALFKSLAEARAREGRGIAGVLQGLVAQIGGLTDAAHSHAAAQPQKLRERIKEQLALLMEAGAGVSEERLAQELALLATKADMREEIDRLHLHVRQAHDLLSAPEAVGRKLDFLAQEFNREANTLCSKAADAGLTSIGLELKAVIDQFREQVQNVE